MLGGGLPGRGGLRGVPPASPTRSLGWPSSPGNPARAQPLSWGTLMPIPPLDPHTGYLPGGDHPAKWSEFEERFTGNISSRPAKRPMARGVTFTQLDTRR